MDLLTLPESSTMSTFTFHSWLIVEVVSDDGLVGIGNAALTPLICKQVIDHHLKPCFLERIPGTSNFCGSTCIAKPWRSVAKALA